MLTLAEFFGRKKINFILINLTSDIFADKIILIILI